MMLAFFPLRHWNPWCLPPAHPMFQGGYWEVLVGLGLLLRKEGEKPALFEFSSPQWGSECIKNTAWDKVDLASGWTGSNSHHPLWLTLLCGTSCATSVRWVLYAIFSLHSSPKPCKETLFLFYRWENHGSNVLVRIKRRAVSRDASSSSLRFSPQCPPDYPMGAFVLHSFRCWSSLSFLSWKKTQAQCDQRW